MQNVDKLESLPLWLQKLKRAVIKLQTANLWPNTGRIPQTEMQNSPKEREVRRIYLQLFITLRKVFRHVSVGNILKILNQCTLISPLISCSLPASYVYRWALRLSALQNKRTILPRTKIGLISFGHRAEFLEYVAEARILKSRLWWEGDSCSKFL